MKFSKVLTMDDELTFVDCEIKRPSKEIKKLFPNDDYVEIIEDGKSYLVNTGYIISLFP